MLLANGRNNQANAHVSFEHHSLFRLSLYSPVAAMAKICCRKRLQSGKRPIAYFAASPVMHGSGLVVIFVPSRDSRLLPTHYTLHLAV